MYCSSSYGARLSYQKIDNARHGVWLRKRCYIYEDCQVTKYVDKIKYESVKCELGK